MSTVLWLRFLHLVGVIVLGAGLLGAFVAELRVRRASAITSVAEGVYYQALFMERMVFPAALVVGISGVLLVLKLGVGFFDTPWITGMWLLFAFEFVEGNSLTRRHGLRVGAELDRAVQLGRITDGLRRSVRSPVGTFGLCLDLPLGLVMVSMGALRPTSWTHFFVAVPLAVATALVLARLLLRLEPRPSKRSLHAALEQTSA